MPSEIALRLFPLSADYRFAEGGGGFGGGGEAFGFSGDVVDDLDAGGEPKTHQSDRNSDPADDAKVYESQVGQFVNDEAAEAGAEAGREVLDRGVGAHEAAPACALDTAGDHSHGGDHAAGITSHQCGDDQDGDRGRDGRQMRDDDQQNGRDRDDAAIDEQLAAAIGEFARERRGDQRKDATSQKDEPQLIFWDADV